MEPRCCSVSWNSFDEVNLSLQHSGHDVGYGDGVAAADGDGGVAAADADDGGGVGDGVVAAADAAENYLAEEELNYL